MNEPMTREQARAFFGVVFRGEHHIPGDVKPFGRGWKINAYTGIATFDWDVLTRLVLHAHDACVRVEIVQGGPGRIGIAIWQRHSRSGDSTKRHPTIEQAVSAWRERHPEPLQCATCLKPVHEPDVCVRCNPGVLGSTAEDDDFVRCETTP